MQGGLGAGVPLFDVAQRLFFTAGTGVFGVFGGGPLPLLCAQCAAVVNVTAGIIAAGVIFQEIQRRPKFWKTKAKTNVDDQ